MRYYKNILQIYFIFLECYVSVDIALCLCTAVLLSNLFSPTNYGTSCVYPGVATPQFGNLCNWEFEIVQISVSSKWRRPVYSTLSMFVKMEKHESFYNIENIFKSRIILKRKMPEYINLYFLPVLWKTLIRTMLFIWYSPIWTCLFPLCEWL